MTNEEREMKAAAARLREQNKRAKESAKKNIAEMTAILKVVKEALKREDYAHWNSLLYRVESLAGDTRASEYYLRTVTTR
jgi:hypothetical protein